MPDHSEVLALLDELQAAECAGAEALARWIASCQDPVLRGGLRVLRARDAGHGALARRRMGELGREPQAPTAARLEALLAMLGAPATSDRVKLGILLSRFPEGARDPLDGVLETLDADDETRAVLDGIRDDDRLGLDWLHDVGHAPPVVPRERVGGSERAGVTAFLAALAAGLRGAAEAAVAWSHASDRAGLRGGLRAIAERSRAHAVAASERAVDLGGHPEATMLAAPALAAACHWYGSDGVGDEHKLSRLLDPGGPGRAALDASTTLAASLVEDVETRELLRLVAAGEAATLAWLEAYRHVAAAVPQAEARRL